MQSLWRASLLTGLAIVLAVLLVPADALGQGKSKAVTFKTADGVTLSGSFYAAGGKKSKDGAVVMLLHNFDHKAGGGSSRENLPTLAKSLQDNGYNVLSFDFRGFGDSKEVNKETFWSKQNKHNSDYIKHNMVNLPDTIDQKNFNRQYYAYLVNDIAAAKAFLDRANDRKEVNSSNLLIIGAGQGATLGAAWVANESYRRRDKRPKDDFIGQPNFAEPEAQDVAGCIWLTLSPGIESRTAIGGTVNTWLIAGGRTSKVPMLFYYGATDKKSLDNANAWVKTVKGTGAKGESLNVKGIGIGGTNLAGSKLLSDSAVPKKILEHLDIMLEARGAREQIDKKVTDSNFYYQKVAKGVFTLNKKAGDEAPLVSFKEIGLTP